MKTSWNLFCRAFIIAFKHSGRRLLCLLCVLLACGGLLAAFFAAPRPERALRMRVGVINLDDNPLSASIIDTLLKSENMTELVEVDMLPADGAGREGCAAVITLPRGFLNSVLTGENLSPVLETNLSSPLESMWVRQLTLAGARALSAAQLSVYAVLEAAQYGEGMEARQYDLLVADVNLRLLEAFFSRLSLLEETRISASGALTLPQYYAAALSAALLFCYGFLFYPMLSDLRRFAGSAGGNGALFLAGALHAAALEALLTLPLFLLFSGSLEPWPWLALSALAGAYALLCAQLFPGRAACAAACLLLTLGQALCGGLLVPLAMLPESVACLARFLPVRQGMELLGTALGQPAGLGPPLLSAALMTAWAALLWAKRRRCN